MDERLRHNPASQYIEETISSNLFLRQDGPPTQHPLFLAYDTPPDVRDQEQLVGVYLSRATADFHLGVINAVREGH